MIFNALKSICFALTVMMPIVMPFYFYCRWRDTLVLTTRMFQSKVLFLAKNY